MKVAKRRRQEDGEDGSQETNSQGKGKGAPPAKPTVPASEAEKPAGEEEDKDRDAQEAAGGSTKRKAEAMESPTKPASPRKLQSPLRGARPQGSRTKPGTPPMRVVQMV